MASSVAPHPEPEHPSRSEPLMRRLNRWLLRASVVGAVVSILVHAVLLLAAMLWQVGGDGRAGGGRGDSPIEMAVTLEIEFDQIMAEAVTAQTPVVPDVATPLPDQPLVVGPPTDDLGSLDDALQDAGEMLSGSGGESGEQSLGVTGAGGGGASFFGVEAAGSRVAYIVDVSGSMRGDKLVALQRELVESLSGLLEHMSFVIVAFSSEAFVLGGRSRWVDAEERGKKWGIERVAELGAAGGTEPAPAFDAVFQMRPRPDVIFFMTDGQFDPALAYRIAVENRGSEKIPIHCISFVDPSAGAVMKEIAEQSGGSYTHIPGPR